MKKITILLMLFLATGCSIVRIDTKSVDNIVDIILSKENSLYNRIGKGYKYYIPRGVSYIDTTELNDTLYSNGNNYYLYIDAINYFYKNEMIYEEENIFYSKKISGNKEGYLKIEKQDNKYHIVFLYNYAKIEAVVPKKYIEEVVLNASYILSTVKFNDNIIELMLNSDYFTNKEEQYDIFSKQNINDNFLAEAEKTLEN